MSGYKPPVVKKSTVRGRAEFAVSKDKLVVQFTLIYKDGKDTLSLKKRMAMSDLPESIQKGLAAGHKNFWISTNADATKVFSGYPLSGVYLVKFGGIPHQDNELPMYKTNIGKFGEYHSFTILHEFVGGPFDGEKVPQFLPYNFDGYNDDNGKRVTAYSKSLDKSKPTQELDRVMDVCGLWQDGAIPWKDTEELYNILPVLDARGQKQSKRIRYQIVLDDGNIVNIIPAQSEMFAADDADDEFDAMDDDFTADTAAQDDDPFADDSTTTISGFVPLRPDVSDDDELPFDVDN